MIFQRNHITHGDSQIYFLKFDSFDPLEYIDRLTNNEKERLLSFNNIDRRREFVATRILRHELFGFEHIHYDENGAPYIEQEGFISISHCKNKIGIAINKQYKVGLDLEYPRKNIAAIQHKFLSEDEIALFNCEDKMVVTRIWSAKEALYKLAGRKGIHFKSELLLSLDKNNNWIGTIDNHDHLLVVKMDIFESEGTIVSINAHEVEKRRKNS